MKRVLLAGLAIAVLFGIALEIRFASKVQDKINAVPCQCEKKRSFEDCAKKCPGCHCRPKVVEVSHGK